MRRGLKVVYASAGATLRRCADGLGQLPDVVETSRYAPNTTYTLRLRRATPRGLPPTRIFGRPGRLDDLRAGAPNAPLPVAERGTHARGPDTVLPPVGLVHAVAGRRTA